MIAFLLVVGLTLFCSGAAMYLSHAAKHDPRWVAGSILMPVVVPLYYRRHWDDLQVGGLLQAAGLVMVITGGLAIGFEPEIDVSLSDARGNAYSSAASDNFSGFVDSDEAIRLISQQAPGTRAAGRVHGERFEPDRIEFIDGVLRLSEGRGFVPDREIAIDFGADAAVSGRLKRIVGPFSLNAPVLQLSWRTPEGEPETLVVSSGYRLEVVLQDSSQGRMSGYVQLAVPDRFKSYISGDLDAVTSHLRYKGGQVDRMFDHEDTVAFVAEEYLMSQYNAEDVQQVTFSGLVVDALDGRAEGTARVQLKDGRTGMHALRLARSEFGWGVLATESAAATDAAGYKPVYNVMPQLALAAAQVRQPPTRKAVAAAPVAEDRIMAFQELAGLVGKGAAVEFRDGRREQGVLRGIERDRLVVESLKGGGTVQFRVTPAEILRLRMNDGSVIRLQEAESAPTAAAVSAASGNAVEASQPVMAGEVDVTRFMNRYVRVVSVDGKVTTGVLRGVNRDRLVIGTMVRGGNVDYTIPVSQLQSIDFTKP